MGRDGKQKDRAAMDYRAWQWLCPIFVTALRGGRGMLPMWCIVCRKPVGRMSMLHMIRETGGAAERGNEVEYEYTRIDIGYAATDGGGRNLQQSADSECIGQV